MPPSAAALAPTFMACFRQRVHEHPDRVFMRQARGAGFTDITFRQASDQALRMAAALAARGDRVAILSKNCWHWIVADLAILSQGATSVPYYPALSAESLREVIALSDLKAIFIGKLDDYSAQAPGVPDELIKVSFRRMALQSLQAACDGMSWSRSTSRSPRLVRRLPQTRSRSSSLRARPARPKASCSTTTRRASSPSPRAPSLSTASFKATARVLSYLPLDHVAERFVTEITGIIAGSEIYFAESLETFAVNLRAARPTMFFAVPRVWTKLREGIIAKLPERWLRRILSVPVLGAAFARVLRKQLGLNDARLVLSSAAPLSTELHAFFARLGIDIQEVYGMSEVGGAATVAARGAPHAGVGQPLPFTEIKIAEGTQEILMRTPWMMTEYFRDPERSAHVLRAGFVHSGDTGRFDERGNLHVIGRLNDTFKTSKGKFVVPAPLELSMPAWPAVDQVLVTGRGLSQPIALVCLSEIGRRSHARRSKLSSRARWRSSMRELRRTSGSRAWWWSTRRSASKMACSRPRSRCAGTG